MQIESCCSSDYGNTATTVSISNSELRPDTRIINPKMIEIAERGALTQRLYEFVEKERKERNEDNREN